MIESTYTPLDLESLTPLELAHAYLNMDRCWVMPPGEIIQRGIMRSLSYRHPWTKKPVDIIIVQGMDFSEQTSQEAMDLLQETKVKEQKRIRGLHTEPR